MDVPAMKNGVMGFAVKPKEVSQMIRIKAYEMSWKLASRPPRRWTRYRTKATRHKTEPGICRSSRRTDRRIELLGQ